MQDLKAKARALKPVLRIGKSGLTEGIIKEISQQLKKKKLLKIKLLKAALSIKPKQELTEELITKTQSVLVAKIGNVITIYKESKKNL